MATAADFEYGDFPADFIEIYNIDKQICDTVGALLKHMRITCDKIVKRKHKKALAEQVHLSGSSTEGGIVSRLFMESPEFPDRINREVEADIEFTMLELPLSLKDVVEDIKEKPGYVKIRYNPKYLNIARSLGWEFNEKDKAEWDAFIHKALQDDYFKPYKLKEYFSNIVRYNDIDEKFELLLAVALRKRKKDVTIKEKQSLTNATVDTSINIKIDGNPLIRCCYDSVPLVRLNWWPAVANEWKERQRAWPSRADIHKLTKIGYVVAKPTEKHDEKTNEMRYAFSHVEKELAKMRTKRQKIIYLMFKIIWVKYVKPFDPEKISSFVAKTVMFWACEQFHPEDDWWKRHYADVLESLFKRMLEVFEKGLLRYYFLPSINVIEKIPKELIENQIIPQLSDISCFIEPFLPKSFGQITEVAKDVLHMSEAVCQVFQDFEQRDYRRLIRQPELIMDVLTFCIYKGDLSVLLHISGVVKNNVIDGFIKEHVCDNVMTAWQIVEHESNTTTKDVEDAVRKDMVIKVVNVWKNIEQNFDKVTKDIGKNLVTSWKNVEPEVKKVVEDIGENLGIAWKDVEQETNKTVNAVGNFFNGVFN